MKESTCTCTTCVRACKCKPGWFSPNEAEKAAKYLGLSLEEFFLKYLVVDHALRVKDIFALSPATTDELPGNMAKYWPLGECIFLKKNKCSIYPVRPYECRAYLHNDNWDLCKNRHQDIADQWDKKKWQRQIKKLLGCSPYPPEIELI